MKKTKEFERRIGHDPGVGRKGVALIACTQKVFGKGLSFGGEI